MILEPELDENLSNRHFDDAKKYGLCDAHILLKIKRNHLVKLRMNVGKGSNTRAKLLTLWWLLWFGNKRGIFDIQIVGDSKAVID